MSWRITVPEITYNMARAALQGNGLGIAEKHAQNHGRILTLQLLKAGLVRALFLEAKGQSQLKIRKAERRTREGNLRGAYKTCCGIIAPEYRDTVTVAQVATMAVWRNVPVYCIDDFPSNYGEPWLKDTTQQGVQVRDKVAAGRFEWCVEMFHDGDRSGCLVLFGAAHFTGTNGVWGKQACLADYLGLDYIVMP
jgi:hypothetical protein